MFLFAFLLTVLGVGAASAIFLKGLAQVTAWRESSPGLIGLAPIVGLFTGVLYFYVGRRSTRGNVLLVELSRNGFFSGVLREIPKAMAPLILVTTWLAHLAGLSVGREGTAVQMAGGIAGIWGRLIGVRSQGHQWLLLHSAIAAGFGSIFGVPLAGAVFAAEVAGAFRSKAPREIKSRHPGAWLLALVASALADLSTRLLGGEHTSFAPIPYEQFLSWRVLGSLLVAAVIFGWTAWLFLELLTWFRKIWTRIVAKVWLRPMVGGVVFSGVFFFPSLYRFLGLGTQVIEESLVRSSSFVDPFLKILFTCFSIGVGFRGGEVTPLFFIGSTMGSAISSLFAVSPAVLGSIGLVSVFGAAAGVPFTCAVMAGELFGFEAGLVALPVCWLAARLCRTARLYDE